MIEHCIATTKMWADLSQDAEKNNDDDDDDEDTPFSRFISRLLKYLSNGFGAKSKIVRYRCMSFLSEIIAHIGELE